jgi:endo-1,4-beta-xylanase
MGKLRVVAAAVVVALVAAVPSGAPAPATAQAVPLRDLARAADVRIGATLEPAQIADPAYAEVLAREFSSVTAENAMKWYAIEPERDAVDFGGADDVLAFAEANDLEVRGHALIWAQDRFTPDWVVAIDDRDELRAEVEAHVRAVLERYRGRIGRWDVVNEPLDTFGRARSDSVFDRVLGPDWIGDVFRLAHEIDPEAELWLNEYGSDWNPDKHRALLALLADLQADGVPIDGIGLQTHRLSVDGPDRAELEQQLRDYEALGLRVAITELDVVVDPRDPAALERQAEAYRTIVLSCLAVAACEEVTTWGVTDRDTWLDALGFPTPTRPLLFDDAFAPKPAYDAVAEVLAAGREAARASSPRAPAPSTPTTTTTAPAEATPEPSAPPAAPVPAVPRLTG